MRSLLALSLLAAAPAAQSLPLVLVGDAVPGSGTVVEVLDVAVNDAGDWMVLVRTSTGAYAALRNGAVFLSQGDALAGPAGTSVAGIVEVGLNDTGETAWVLGLNGTTAFHGVYFGTTPVALDGDPSAALPGASYTRLFRTQMNDARQILASIAVDDAGAPGFIDRALVVMQVDAAGALQSETLVIQEGSPIAGTSGTVVLLPELGAEFALNDAGDSIYWALATGGPDAVMWNATPLAVTGGTSPVFGRTWKKLDRSAVDAGGGGDHVFTGLLSGDLSSDAIIAWNGIKFVQEGDTLDAIKPFALEQGGSLATFGSPVFLTDAGQVVWYGVWNDPDGTRDSGFFRDHELFVQEGVSVAAGLRLDTFGAPGYEFQASDDGRWLIFEGELENGQLGAFLLDLQVTSTPYAGCTPHASTLSTSTPQLGATLALLLYDVQAPGVPGFAALATEPATGFPPCGIPLGTAGELLVDVVPPNPILVLGPAPDFGVPGLPAFFSTVIPSDLSLLGLKLYAQGIFADLSGVSPGEPLRLSNGVELTFGL